MNEDQQEKNVVDDEVLFARDASIKITIKKKGRFETNLDGMVSPMQNSLIETILMLKKDELLEVKELMDRLVEPKSDQQEINI